VPRKFIAIACVIALAPAAAQAQRTPGDPYEKLNRKSFAFSMKLDHNIIGPLAKLSRGLTPGPLVRVIHNIIVNLSEPQVIINDLLQLRPQRAIEATTRVIVNSTFGLAGAIDVAAGAGLRYHPNGFGDTLGHYGVKTGPYLYIPILGPSDVRDIAGSGVDQVSSPIVWIDFPYRTPINLSLGIAGGLQQRAAAGPQLEALLTSAADPYATLRSTYLQAREAQIRGETALPPLPDIEGPGEAAPSTNTPQPESATPPSDAAPGAPAPSSQTPAEAPQEPAPQVSPSPAPALPASGASPEQAPSAGSSPASPPSPAMP
jgi:phospholipid-binding lipoprotein MlaA